MYALSFDMEVTKLKEYYGAPFNEAYEEIKNILIKSNFNHVHGNLYILIYGGGPLTFVYQAIKELSNVQWFKESVKEILVFKIDNNSDITEIIKG